MTVFDIQYCPGTLAKGHQSYSTTCLRRMFKGRKVSHILPYDFPASNHETSQLFIENQQRISISGVQEKFSILQEKNKLRLIEEGEQGQFILKPIPNFGKNLDQMPANEHLTMQIARQVFDIETAENALVFFQNGDPAYITKRFDVTNNGEKLAVEDFSSLAGRTPQTHGDNYKYLGNYLQLFELTKKYLPAWRLEVQKLYQLILFNYLFSNGDAHFKNFSVLETQNGDFKLSPAYDLLNTQIHINDSEFALEEDLLPKNLAKGKIMAQFQILANEAELSQNQIKNVHRQLLSNSDKVASLIEASFLRKKVKRSYLQAYQTRYKKLIRE